jgi:hypothetical protein
MRYKACTPADIAFLRTRISNATPGRQCITDDKFRNVSIITALNVHKDEINRIGSLRYGIETSQDLVDFFSEDTVSGSDDIGEKKSRKAPKSHVIIKMTDQIQEALWNQPPSSNDKCIPGKLSLCHGMPVIIRSNSATELCITRGQEGVVYGWQATIGSKGQRMLDALFVELKNPPKPVQFEGLAPNVVPLTRTSATIKCSLPNDEYITISRNQIEVLPNFAMTDYSAQGKTRPCNVVDLNNCRTHQSYYTALSRSASAAGTCILQGFDPRMVTGGASGALRQEFRKLEVLDDIVRIRYEGKLPATIVGDRRHEVINSFRLWKGDDYMPAHVHKAIRWSKHSPFHVDTDDLVQSWKRDGENIPIHTNVKKGNISLPLVVKNKRKCDSTEDSAGNCFSPVKKLKSQDHVTNVNSRNLLMPLGTIWSNNSCAYDCIITILHSIWLTDTARLRGLQNDILNRVVASFTEHQDGLCSLEDSRDSMRQQLMTLAPNSFPWGAYVAVDSIFDQLLETSGDVLSSERICPQGHAVQRRSTTTKNCMFNVHGFSGSAQYWMSRMETRLSSRCRVCGHTLVRKFLLSSKPPLFVMSVDGASVHPSLVIQVNINNEIASYCLRGIAYIGNGHFVSRIITPEANVWYHDGIESGRNMVLEPPLPQCDLRVCNGKTPAVYVYVLQ